MPLPKAPSNERPMDGSETGRPGVEGGKRDLNRKKRIAELLDAALDLFLVRSIEGTTIAEITAGAGTAKGSFYRYFQDKKDLVRALIEPLSQMVEDAFTEADANLAKARESAEMVRAFHTLGMRLVPGVLLQPRLVILYLQECRGTTTPSRHPIETLRERVDAGALSLTVAAQAQGVWRAFPAQISAYAVVGAVEKSLFALLCAEEEVNPAEWTRALVSLILDGLTPR